MKRILSGLIIFCLATCIFCGCTDKDTNSNLSSEVDLQPVVSEQEIIDELFDVDYNAGYFSIKVGEVIEECADCDISVYKYEDNKNSLIAENAIAYIEGTELNFKQYLDTSYIVHIQGKILQNPDIAHYYSAEQTIMTAVMVYDENGNFINNVITTRCNEFDTCATLMCVD